MESRPPPSIDSGDVVHEKGTTAHDEEIAAPELQGHDYAGEDQDEDLEPEIHWKAYMVIISCGVSYASLVWVLVTMGLQSANVVKSVGGGAVSVWIVNSSTLVAVVIAPPLSRISDAVGRKWITIGMALGGVVGCILIGAANSIGMAVAGGCLCGGLIALQGFYSAIKSPRDATGQWLKDGSIYTAVIANFVEGVFFFPFNTFVGTQGALLYETEPLKVGFFFTCYFLPAFVFYPLCGWYTKRTFDAKGPLVAGYLLFIPVMIGFAQTGVNEASQKAFYVLAMLAGIAFVPAETLLQTVAQLAVPADLIGTSAALGAAIRTFGGVLGVAITSSIFQSKVGVNVPLYVAPAALAAGLPDTSVPAFITYLAEGDVAALANVPGATAEVIAAGAIALKEGYAQCFKYIWYFEVPFMVLALVCVAMLSSLKGQMNWIINRPVEKITYKHGETVAHHKETARAA
ncbi:hypothetical protein RQP46_007101 [Phenoliferia psychrophenolica]